MNTIIVLAIILIILNIWNLFGYYDLKKYNRSYRELKDDRYYELKYKTEFITASAVVVLAVGGFFGYDISKNAKDITERIQKAEINLTVLGDSINTKGNSLSTYQTRQSSYKDTLDLFEKRIKEISGKIDVMNDKSIIKQDLYLVDKIEYKSDYVWKSDNDTPDTLRYYYSNLQSIKGEDLPIFDKAPFLALVPDTPVQLVIYKITKDYFIVLNTGNSFNIGNYWDKTFFGIMVSQR